MLAYGIPIPFKAIDSTLMIHWATYVSDPLEAMCEEVFNRLLSPTTIIDSDREYSRTKRVATSKHTVAHTNNAVPPPAPFTTLPKPTILQEPCSYGARRPTEVQPSTSAAPPLPDSKSPAGLTRLRPSSTSRSRRRSRRLYSPRCASKNPSALRQQRASSLVLPVYAILLRLSRLCWKRVLKKPCPNLAVGHTGRPNPV